MLHTVEVTREVNFEIRGNPWKLDSRAVKLKTFNCILLTDFQHTKLYPIENLSLRFILIIVQPRLDATQCDKKIYQKTKQ